MATKKTISRALVIGVLSLLRRRGDRDHHVARARAPLRSRSTRARGGDRRTGRGRRRPRLAPARGARAHRAAERGSRARVSRAARQMRGAAALAALLGAACSPASPERASSPAPAAAGARLVRALSWNVFLFPRPIGLANSPDCRIDAIAEFIHEQRPDVIALQETFDRESSRRLAERLSIEFPYQVRSAPQSWARLNGGALALRALPARARRDRDLRTPARARGPIAARRAA